MKFINRAPTVKWHLGPGAQGQMGQDFSSILLIRHMQHSVFKVMIWEVNKLKGLYFQRWRLIFRKVQNVWQLKFLGCVSGAFFCFSIWSRMSRIVQHQWNWPVSGPPCFSLFCKAQLADSSSQSSRVSSLKSGSRFLMIPNRNTHIHTHTHICICIKIYVF